jgi:hypothetical protein
VAEGDALATGQVFLIRPSGDSLRLGSVRVQLFDAETMSRHLVERGRSLALQQEELRARVAALEAEVDQALEDRDQADAAYREREAEIRISLGAYVEQQEARKATLQQGIESNRAFIDSVDSLPPPPDGVPSREENLAYEERRQKWLSMNRAERMNWGVVLSSLNADLEAEIRTLAAEREEKVFALSDELQALDLRIAEGDAAVRAAVAALAGTRQRLADFPQYGDYLSELPSPIEEGRTDADGEFAFTLRLDRSYVLFADAERVMGGETQYFTWLVRVNAGGGRPVRLVLSNHNLLGAEGAERVITLPGHLAPSET